MINNEGYSLPEDFKKYFWDCNFQELSWEKYSFFITEPILNSGNLCAVKWLLKKSNRKFIKEVVKKSRNLDKKTRNFRVVFYEE